MLDAVRASGADDQCDLAAVGCCPGRRPGWTEISAVCTDPAHRGQGLATRLVRAVADGIRARGETPFLHTAASNATAIRLYESIGFRLRRATMFGFYRADSPQVSGEHG